MSPAFFNRQRSLGYQDFFSLSMLSLTTKLLFSIQFGSVAQLCLTLCNPMDCRMPGFLVHHQFPNWWCSNWCPLSQWCHSTISSSVIPFSFCLQSFPASFPMSWLFASGGQNIVISASTSVLPMNIQGWFPLGLTCLILLLKGFSRVFCTTVQRNQFFSAQSFLLSSSHICTWLLEKL